GLGPGVGRRPAGTAPGGRRPLRAGRRRHGRGRCGLMDFEWGEEVEALRAEVRAFLAEALPPEKEERLYESGESHDDEFARTIGARHWIGGDWEREGF